MRQISSTTHLTVPDVVFVIAPVAGAGRAVNERPDETPELVNEDPYGACSICEITRADNINLTSQGEPKQ